MSTHHVIAEGTDGPDFSSLPEDCISRVLSLTTPRDACRSAAASSEFSRLSRSDAVWERFLPSDHGEMLSRSVDPVVGPSTESKRELYLRICRPIVIDGGKMSFALERSSGKKCYMVSARELLIIWGDNPNSWRWFSMPGSRFREVAELLNVYWLEIHGKFNTRNLSPRTNYAAYLIYKLAHHTHGLDSPTQETMVKVGTHVSRRSVRLQPLNESKQRREDPRNQEVIKRLWESLTRQGHKLPDLKELRRAGQERDDGWMEAMLGEFYNADGDDGEMDMCLMELKGGHLKGGLIIQGIELKPKQ
ncbi:F-box protein [Acorus calamus]|uniref:F-box protein n=1 Tax=Acorus calamus TaxID=4465 RepID=A0AAV9C558_ACOCL|nr:F-box protein [Acorus calamus]